MAFKDFRLTTKESLSQADSQAGHGEDSVSDLIG